MLNFHRIFGMRVVIVSCDEADQIRANSVFEMAKGRYYIRQDIKACFSLYSLGLLSCNLLYEAYGRHTLIDYNLYNLGINNRLQLHVML